MVFFDVFAYESALSRRPEVDIFLYRLLKIGKKCDGLRKYKIFIGFT